ncbi:TPA: BrnT family toxin [Mannheimia haemolytica]|nr:BrnT family toxin [Mannheimia haemolytica]
MEDINGFEWDSEKALRNQQKHGVSFIEAVSVFYDNNAMLIPDPDHSSGEERFLLLGRSNKDNLLVVVHCERNTNIRIISARLATKRESGQYKGVH